MQTLCVHKSSSCSKSHFSDKTYHGAITMAKQHSAAKISQKMWALDFLQSRTSHYSISFESLVSSLAGHLNSHHTSQAHMRLPMFTHLQQVSIRFKTNPADQANCLSRKL